MTPVEAALEEIIDKEKEFEKQYSSEDSDKKENAGKDRKNGEEMRQELLETFGQTKKRKLLNSEENDIETKVRKNRQSGTDALAYLKEKSDKEMEVKKEELQIKKKLQQDQIMEQRSLRQQQAHMVKAFSAMQQSIQRQLLQQQKNQ